MTAVITPEVIARFWSKVDKSGECWVWLGGKNRNGYGVFRYGGKADGRMVDAHRFSYEITYGVIPAGAFICHHCDNPPCARPDHLFKGSLSDNVLDSARKGRHIQSRKTRCPRGHEYTPENTITEKGGARRCRRCRTGTPS